MAQDAQRKMIGDPGRLAFELREEHPQPKDVRGLGWAGLVLWAGGDRVWARAAGDGAICWTWVDLVEHLAAAWPWLLYEEVAPFGLVAEGPEQLREARFLGGVSGKSPTEVEEAVHAYQQRHDLAAGLKGIGLAPVWLLREGRQFRIRTNRRDLRLPLEEVMQVLEDFVAAVRALVGDQPSSRAQVAFEKWVGRTPSQARVIALRTSLSGARLKEWTPSGVSLEAYWGAPGIPDDAPMMAAARLSLPLAEQTRKVLLDHVFALAPRETPQLDELSKNAAPVVESIQDQKPYAQGHTLALWLRKTLGRDVGPIDPEALLKSWNVEVGELPRLESQLDAVACWGVGKGPSILVNPAGVHANSPGGRRATLAHEIAHLLVDRSRSLPAADVIGGGTPQFLEQRARAFAAEFLLPREDAASVLARAESLESAARRLLGGYGVSNEVLGWQIQNGPGWHLLGQAEKTVVRRWCKPWRPGPARFTR